VLPVGTTPSSLLSKSRNLQNPLSSEFVSCFGPLSSLSISRPPATTTLLSTEYTARTPPRNASVSSRDKVEAVMGPLGLSYKVVVLDATWGLLGFRDDAFRSGRAYSFHPDLG
jgi:hypothetical protein